MSRGGDGRTSSRLPRLAWPLTPMAVLSRCRARRAAPRRAPRGRNPEQGRLCRGAGTATLRCVSHGAGLVRCERARAPQGFRCRCYVAQVRIDARAYPACVSACGWACVRVISAGTVKKSRFREVVRTGRVNSVHIPLACWMLTYMSIGPGAVMLVDRRWRFHRGGHSTFGWSATKLPNLPSFTNSGV